MTSERFKGGTAFTTVHAFAVAFNAISAGNAPALAALLRAQQINDAPNDPFGLLETNAGGLPAVPDALPMHVELQVGAVTSACLTNVAGTNNKVGKLQVLSLHGGLITSRDARPRLDVGDKKHRCESRPRLLPRRRPSKVPPWQLARAFRPVGRGQRLPRRGSRQEPDRGVFRPHHQPKMNAMKKKTRARTAATWIAMVLAAASSSTHAAPASMTQAQDKPNGSGVSISYRVDGVPQVGRTTSVTLAFESVSNVNGATVSLTTDAGLSIQSERALSLPAGQRTEAQVTVLNEREGLFYLNVFVLQGTRRSVISVPVKIGTAAPVMKSTGVLVRDAQGQWIMSMPAK
jgi:hypothetical protein